MASLGALDWNDNNHLNFFDFENAFDIGDPPQASEEALYQIVQQPCTSFFDSAVNS
jgi:hypothetical protein